MKLELKHLAPYLPYRLKMKFVSKYNVDRLSNEDISELKTIDEGFICINGYRTNNKSYLPILRPLSDLTKEIEHNGEKFIPIIKLAKIQYPKVDFEIRDFRCLGRLNSGVCLEFTIEDEIPFYKEYHNNIFLQRKSENYDDMFLANLKPSEVREKLFEWHFDVYGLIDAGLAIDINTI